MFGPRSEIQNLGVFIFVKFIVTDIVPSSKYFMIVLGDRRTKGDSLSIQTFVTQNDFLFSGILNNNLHSPL